VNKGGSKVKRILFLVSILGMLAFAATAFGAKDYAGRVAKYDPDYSYNGINRTFDSQCSEIDSTALMDFELISNKCAAGQRAISCELIVRKGEYDLLKTHKYVRTSGGSYWIREIFEHEKIIKCSKLTFAIWIDKNLDTNIFETPYLSMNKSDSSGWYNVDETWKGERKLLLAGGWVKVKGSLIGDGKYKIILNSYFRKDNPFHNATGPIVSSTSKRIDERFFKPVGEIKIGKFRIAGGDFIGFNNGSDRMSYHSFNSKLVKEMTAPYVSVAKFSAFDYDSYAPLNINMRYKIIHPQIKTNKQLRNKISSILKSKDPYVLDAATNMFGELSGNKSGNTVSVRVFNGSTIDARFVKEGYYYLKYKGKINNCIEKEVLMDSMGSKTRKDKGNRGTIE
jgi:hypothetical protein